MYYIKNAQAITQGKADKETLAVEAPDDYTLVTHLESRTPYFLQLTDTNIYYPVRKDVVEGKEATWTESKETLISNGPFKLEVWKHQDHITAVKNDHYWDSANIKLDKLEFVMVVEASTSYAAYQAGTVDHTPIPREQIPKLIEEKNPDLQIVPSLGTYYYCFNMEKPLWKDIRIRKALALAIDKKGIADTVRKSGELPASGIVPPGIPLSDGKDFREVAGDYGLPENGDPEQAKKLLAEAGYPGGQGFPVFEFLYSADEENRAVAEAVQQMWKNVLGIQATLHSEEWTVYAADRVSGNYTICMRGWTGDYIDAMTFLDVFRHGSGQDIERYDVAAYNDDVAKAKATEGEERDKVMMKAEKQLVEDQPIIPIFYTTRPVMSRHNIKGIYESVLGSTHYRDAYIE